VAQVSVAQAAMAQAATQPLRILHHEAFSPLAQNSVGQRKTDPSSATRFKFDAFGRHFGLTLEKNSGIAQWVDTQSPSLSLYRGALDNVPGSWARMSAKAEQIRGMIWDGHDLYVIDSAAALGGDADKTTDAATIIYRLSDTQIEPGAAFCGSDATTGKAAYSTLVEELKGSPTLMQAAGASLRLEVSALADSLLRARYSGDEETRDEILARLNNVDGIFSSQIGVEIQIPSFAIDDQTTQQLSTSTNPTTLVKNLASLRSKTPTLRSRGLSHLFTGRDLDGTTVGIAYTDSLCSSQWSVGLTQMGRSVGIDSLITAHEIGHNFGAVHDGEKQCASTPVNQFIMSPTVSPNAITFSSCSLDAILPRKRTAHCLAALPPPDLSLSSTSASKSAAVREKVEWKASVANLGGSAAQGARLTVTTPASVTIEEISASGAQCSRTETSATCDLGDIVAGGSRELRGVLIGSEPGSYTVTAQVSAANENSPSNNRVQGTLLVTPEVDLAISMSVPSSAIVGTSVTVSFSVQNMTSAAAEDLRAQITVPSSLSVASAQLMGNACAIEEGSIQCPIDDLAAGASMNGAVLVTATAAGTASIKATISGSDLDTNPANDEVEQTLTVTQPVVVQSAQVASKQSGGGGGSLPWPLLVSLAAFLRLRARTRAL
jgi:hypothetical protein